MSAAGPGRLSRSASKVVVKPANGYHLMRIDGYSQTKTLLPGQKLSSQPFIVGDHSWRIDYYPNGRAESNSGAISVYLQLTNPTTSPQQARYKFSLLDKDGIASYELEPETRSFTGVPEVNPYYNPAQTGHVAGAGDEQGPGHGHEEFIGKEELEKRRGDLIRNDSIVIRCDVGVTQIETTYLAQDDIQDQLYYSSREYGHGYGHGPPRRHGRQRRADDNQYVQWCLNQGADGGSRDRNEEEEDY